MLLTAMDLNVLAGVDSGNKPSRTCSLPQCRTCENWSAASAKLTRNSLTAALNCSDGLARIFLALYRIFGRFRLHHQEKLSRAFAPKNVPIEQQAVNIGHCCW